MNVDINNFKQIKLEEIPNQIISEEKIQNIERVSVLCLNSKNGLYRPTIKAENFEIPGNHILAHLRLVDWLPQEKLYESETIFSLGDKSLKRFLRLFNKKYVSESSLYLFCHYSENGNPQLGPKYNIFIRKMQKL